MIRSLLETRGLSKSYGDISVLSDISLKIGFNEIVGIAGENGAGKSTVLKLMSGVIVANGGDMLLSDAAYRPDNYHNAVTRGVSMVFQEQALIGNLRIYENIFYGFEALFKRAGLWLDHTHMRHEATDKLAKLGFGHIDANALADDLPFHERQMVEIARAFILSDYSSIEHPLILLDEPTAAIGEREVKMLFEAVKRLRDKASFVIVTHKLSEYIELCDRVYVFKDGAMAGELSGQSLVDREVHKLMVGRVRDEELYHEDRQNNQFGAPRLQVERLHGEYLQPVSFDIAAGEVLGIGGLIGCGKEEVVRAIVGHKPYAEGGKITLNDQVLPNQWRTSRATEYGLGFVPKERKTEGMVGYMSVSGNISLPALDRVSRLPGIISPAQETRQAEQYIKELSIRTSGPRQDAVFLSGGNQQKLVLAKWLARGVSVMVLDNPTRGVDIGAKSEIYSIIRKLAAEGVSILLITDDLLELIGLSNRILVMRAGAVSGEMDAPTGGKPTEHDIVRYMT